jgi:hypothetical protein
MKWKHEYWWWIMTFGPAAIFLLYIIVMTILEA